MPPGKADDCEGHGRPLVEVFAVRAGFHFLGTIAAFDGRRGQIIYDSSSNDFKQAPVRNFPYCVSLLMANAPYFSELTLISVGILLRCLLN